MNAVLFIRNVVESDYTTWKPLYLDYSKVWNVPITEDRLIRLWELLLSPKHSTHGIAGCVDDSLIGFGHYIVSPCLFSTNITCHLHDLYVSPGYRNRGFAGTMIQHIAETGRGEGWNSMRWQARKTNKSAQKLYDKIAKRVPSQSEDEFIHYELELLPDAPRIEVLKSGIESTMPNQALDSTSFAGDAHCVAVASGGSGRESA